MYCDFDVSRLQNNINDTTIVDTNSELISNNIQSLAYNINTRYGDRLSLFQFRSKKNRPYVFDIMYKYE